MPDLFLVYHSLIVRGIVWFWVFFFFWCVPYICSTFVVFFPSHPRALCFLHILDVNNICLLKKKLMLLSKKNIIYRNVNFRRLYHRIVQLQHLAEVIF